MDKMKALDKEGRDEVAAILDPNISYKNQVKSFNSIIISSLKIYIIHLF